MPKLNLDIFGSENDETPKRTVPKPAITTPVDTPARKEPATHTVAAKSPTVRFIPVGFHEKHLRLLDDAVLSLRRQGIWNASRSAIIRRLIEKYADELDRP